MSTDGADIDRRLERFHTVRVPRASDEALAMIADAIRGGLYREGDRLPRLDDLASRLGVSKYVVREAMDVLRREGIVSVKRGNSGGTTVLSTENLSRVLASLGGETHSNLRTLLEARRALEIAAGIYASEHATDADLERLAQFVDDLTPLIDQPDEFLATDARFHSAFVQLSNNALLTEWHERVLNQIFFASSMFPVGRIDPQTAIAHQRRTLVAFEKRDARTISRALDAHLSALEEVFLGQKLSSY